jgi:hypothetical protein
MFIIADWQGVAIAYNSLFPLGRRGRMKELE